jgi:hypothetical protein
VGASSRSEGSPERTDRALGRHGLLPRPLGGGCTPARITLVIPTDGRSFYSSRRTGISSPRRAVAEPADLGVATPVDRTVLIDAHERMIVDTFNHADPRAEERLRAHFEVERD